MKQPPILIIVFNRPDVTQRLFEAIKKIEPPKLYIVADGARQNVDGEEKCCNEVKQIFEKIDWVCEVKKLYRKENMGCDPSIIDGINWFFKNEEYGIILEDDCIPTKSFYKFCCQLLNIHENNPEIAIISGSNYYNKQISTKYDYFIGDLYYLWGWATWRHVWNTVDWNKRYSLEDVRNKLMNVYENKKFINILYKNIYYAYEQITPHWDAIFYLHNLFQNKKAIIPSQNQINNIGTNGTHFQNSKSKIFNTKTFETSFTADISKNYKYLSKELTNKLIKSYLKKYFPLTFRDRLYLIKKQLIKKIFKN